MMSLISIRNQVNTIVVIGMRQLIIQSILDFDYYAGKKEPSVTSIVTGNNGYEKFFWGNTECLIETTQSISQTTRGWFLNVLSGRRALSPGVELMHVPAVYGGVFFAENVPEQHALTLYQEAQKNEKLCIGPSSVGLLVPGYLKLGPVGGITPVSAYASIPYCTCVIAYCVKLPVCIYSTIS